MPRRVPVCRTLLRSLVVAFLVLVAGYTVWTWQLGCRFETRVEALRAEGEPLTLEDLARKPLPQAEDATALFARMHASYAAHLTPKPDARIQLVPLSVDEIKALRRWTARGEPYVTLLEEAAARPHLRVRLSWEDGPTMDLPHLTPFRDAERYLAHRARWSADADVSLRALVLMLTLADKLDDRRLLLVLARWTAQRHAAETLEAIARRPAFDASRASATLSPYLVRADERSEALSWNAALTVRADALSLVRRWIDGDSPLGWTRPGIPHHEIDDRLAERALGSLPARLLAYRDGLRMLNDTAVLRDILGKPSWEALPEIHRRFPEPGFRFPFYVSGSNRYLWTVLLSERAHLEARMRVARVGLAALAYRQSTGAWPATLDDLAPSLGGAVPPNPFTGDPLTYEPGVLVAAEWPEWTADDTEFAAGHVFEWRLEEKER